MRNSWLVAAAGALAVLRADAAAGAECSVPVTPYELASALKAGPGASLPGQLAGVPFSVVSLEQMTLSWQGCGQDCVSYQFLGETECGDLAGTPIDAVYLALYPDALSPTLISTASADQRANGKWRISAQGWVVPTGAPANAAAGYTFELGTREVIDVTSSGGTDPLPLSIGIRAGTWIDVSVCGDDGYFRWNPLRDLRFRVTEQPAAGSPRTLVDTVFYDQFVLVDDVYPVEVTPGSTLTADVFLRISANATGAQDGFGNICEGGRALLDMDPRIVFLNLAGGSPALDGIQLLFSPDPALTVVPRSGLVYEPVPEPGASASAGTVLGALALARRRSRSRSPSSYSISCRLAGTRARRSST